MRLVDGNRLEEMVKIIDKPAWMIVRDMPTVDAVPKKLFDHFKWERDVAIEQLFELGIGFGEKVDGVYLSKEEYEELLEYKHMYDGLCV